MTFKQAILSKNIHSSQNYSVTHVNLDIIDTNETILMWKHIVQTVF